MFLIGILYMINFFKYTNKLTSFWEHQKFASRIGYMGAAFLMAGQWTLEAYIIYSRFYMCNHTSIIS